jgi:hypothetical protein
MMKATEIEIARRVFTEYGCAKYGEFLAPNSASAKFVTNLLSDIATKNADALMPRLHTMNPASREVFFRLTGVRLCNTNRESARQIDEWAGVTPEERARRDARCEGERRAAAAREKRDAELRALVDAWKRLESVGATDGGTVPEHLRRVAARGGVFSTRRSGAVTRPCVEWTTSGGEELFFPKYTRKHSDIMAYIATVLKVGKKHFGTLQATLHYVDADNDTHEETEAAS